MMPPFNAGGIGATPSCGSSRTQCLLCLRRLSGQDGEGARKYDVDGVLPTNLLSVLAVTGIECVDEYPVTTLDKHGMPRGNLTGSLEALGLWGGGWRHAGGLCGGVQG